MDSIRFLRIRKMELIVAKIPTQAGIRRSLAVERIAMVVPILMSGFEIIWGTGIENRLGCSRMVSTPRATVQTPRFRH